MKKSKNNINIGRMLTQYMMKNKLTKSELALLINKHRVTVMKYTENESMQTNTLIDISYALKHNFLQDVANGLPIDFTSNKPIDPERAAQEEAQKTLIAQLKEENNTLRIQNELLMKLHVGQTDIHRSKDS
jgi:hypothetical protein